jgi:predicted nucleic acid-binding Zn ribbon protein
MKFRIGDKRKNCLNSFENILPDIIHDFELEKSFTIEELISQWSFIVGDIISTHSKPDKITNKILFVAVDHSVYANELILMKDIIIKKIQEELPFLAIKDIRAEIKKISWNRS